MVVEVVVVPLGSFPRGLASEIALSVVDRLPVPARALVSVWKPTPPLTLFAWRRRQFRADGVLDFLASQMPGARPPHRLILGISEADGYINGLNFVFGLASPERGVAVVFARRLRSHDPVKYKARLVKEALHEIGHLLGLEHCDTPGCVMNFSNSVDDVDRKNDRFCERCVLKIKEHVRN